jgi:Protein of unknown function (DUF4019)
MRIRSNIVLLAAVLFPSPARAQIPDSASAAISAAQTAASSWLSLVDKSRYGESWDSAAALFKKGVTKAGWESAVRQARGSVDPLGGRRLTSAGFSRTLPNVPPGEYVVLQYETQAAHGKTVVETVTPMKDLDGAWRVSGYYIRPR